MPPTYVDISKLSFDDDHINQQRTHRITIDQAIGFIRDARISVTVWNGRYERYYAFDGAAYVDTQEMLIRTAFGKINSMNVQ